MSHPARQDRANAFKISWSKSRGRQESGVRQHGYRPLLLHGNTEYIIIYGPEPLWSRNQLSSTNQGSTNQDKATSKRIDFLVVVLAPIPSPSLGVGGKEWS